MLKAFAVDDSVRRRRNGASSAPTTDREIANTVSRMARNVISPVAADSGVEQNRMAKGFKLGACQARIYWTITIKLTFGFAPVF